MLAAMYSLSRNPERSEGSLYFAVAVAVAFLVVIPEGDLLLLLLLLVFALRYSNHY
jgi:hypothetical protein